MLRTVILFGLFCLSIGTVLVLATGAVAADDVTVDITVVDQAGEPVGNAELTVSWEDGEETVETTGSGGALVEVPEGADVQVEIDHPVYVRNHPFEISNATVPEGESRLTVEIPTSLSGTAELTIEDSNGPVADARVLLRDEDGRAVHNLVTDQNGVITTERLEQETYNVTITKAEYLQKTTEFQLDGNVQETIQIERGSVIAQFELRDDYFDPAEPIEGVRIQFEDGTTLTTNEDGQARTDVRVNQEYDITVTKDEYREKRATLVVEESDHQLNITLRRTPAIGLQAANQRVVLNESTLVTVRNEYDEPVVDAPIRVDGEEVGVTDENGEFMVPITETGEKEISVSADGLSDSVVVEGVQAAPEETPTPTPTPEATPTPEQTPTPTPADDDGPGFGIVAGLLAIMAVALYVRRD